MKNKISIQNYTTFINYVSDKIIEEGIEYREFWIAYTLATMFFDFKAETTKNGEIIVNDIWEQLDNVKVIPNNEQISVIDIVFNDFNICESGFPINYAVYNSMINKIDEKVRNHTTKENNKTPLNESLAFLVHKFTAGIDKYQEKLEDINFSEMFELLQTVSSELNNEKEGKVITSAK